jgi:predicted Fe-Mo cluster-binding NifX family protein
MKAIAVKEDNINSLLEDCFGKAKYYCFVDDNPDKIAFALNPGYDLINSSGKQAVAYLLTKGVTTVLSRNYGVSVKKILNKHNIQTVIIPQKYESLTQILEKMRHKT